MTTYTLNQQQLDQIVDDISQSDIEWDDNHSGHIYSTHNFDGINVTVAATFNGHDEANYITFEGRSYYEGSYWQVDGLDDVEVIEFYADNGQDIDVNVDLDYIFSKLENKDFN